MNTNLRENCKRNLRRGMVLTINGIEFEVVGKDKPMIDHFGQVAHVAVNWVDDFSYAHAGWLPLDLVATVCMKDVKSV